MSKSSLQQLVELVEFDQKLIKVEQEIEALQREVDDAKGEIDLCLEGTKRFETLAKETQKEVDNKELDMNSLDDQIKERRDRLDMAANQKEYKSISTELESLQKKQHSFEQELVDAWKKFEHAQQELASRKQFCEAKVDASNSIIEQKMREIADLKTSLETHKKERTDKVHGIEDELLERYATMRARVVNPVVPVDRGSCTGCFYKVVQQDLVNLKQGKLMQCKDCFRFIYLPEVDVESPQSDDTQQES